jgi:hypothetical protein
MHACAWEQVTPGQSITWQLPSAQTWPVGQVTPMHESATHVLWTQACEAAQAWPSQSRG